MNFRKKTLKGTETIGGYLTELLEQERKTVEELAAALHFQERHMRALLADHCEVLPDAYYGKHLARRLAASLGGNADYAERLFLCAAPRLAPEETAEQAFSRGRVRARSLFVVARFAAGSLIASVFLVLLVYFGLNIRRALMPPALEISSPSADMVTLNRTVTVSGRTEPEVTLRVNGQLVTLDADGRFSTILYLEEGLNDVEAVAVKRYSKPQTVFRRVLVETKRGEIGAGK